MQDDEQVFAGEPTCALVLTGREYSYGSEGWSETSAICQEGGETRDPYHRRRCPTRHRHSAARQAGLNRGQAMRIRWRTRQYERTCDDCGHAWRVPRWAAHPPTQGRPVSGRCEGGVPPPMAAGGIGETAVAATAHLAERTTAFRRCRECGSEHYKQRSIWSWTDDPNC